MTKILIYYLDKFSLQRKPKNIYTSTQDPGTKEQIYEMGAKLNRNITCEKKKETFL
jgi:hypothetical protein